ncbi:helix-turn-helix domain-containing protein [Agromyces sp. MMS24-K17]|uniref:helix-turn-helix domain-containing protein n=1 Tax=Agromyces sp. MMS24-K17 TaxID=3372850 RepID=UPI0037542091
MSGAAAEWAMRNDGERSTAQQIVLITIGDHYNERVRRAWPSRERIAARTRLKVRSIVDALNALALEGVIEREVWRDARSGAQLSTRYALPLYDPTSRASSHEVLAVEISKGNWVAAGGAADARGEGASNARGGGAANASTPVQQVHPKLIDTKHIPKSVHREALNTIDDAFDSWWAVYPKKQGKVDARKAFAQLYKRGDLPELGTLIARTKRYAAKQTDPTYTKQPAGWLRTGRYEDDDLAVPVAKRSDGARQMSAWLEARGSSLAEYEQRKGEPGWLEALKQREAS